MEQRLHADERSVGLRYPFSYLASGKGLLQSWRGISCEHYSAGSLFNLHGSDQWRRLCWSVCLPTSFGNRGTDSDTERPTAFPTKKRKRRQKKRMGKRPKENSANEMAVGPCQSRASLPRNFHKKWDKREMPTADERPLPKREAWTRAHSESFRETDLEELAE